MSSGSSGQKPKKGSRVSGVQMPPNRFVLAFDMLKRADVVVRLGMCILAGALILVITQGWKHPFEFSEGDVPERSITARVPFSTVNEEETAKSRELARRQVVTIYRNNSGIPEQLRLQLIEKVRLIHRVESLEELSSDPTNSTVWQDFMHGITPSEGGTKTNAQYFAEFKAALAQPGALDAYKEAVGGAMRPIDEKGILSSLQHEFDLQGGNQEQIRVYSGDETAPMFVAVEDVRIDNVVSKLKGKLESTLSEPLARHTFAWFQAKDRLVETLDYDPAATQRAQAEAAAAVEIVPYQYAVDAELAKGGRPLTPDSIELLMKEYEAAWQGTSIPQMLSRTVASLGMYATIFSLCGFYSHFRRVRVLTDAQSLFRVLTLSVVTITLCRFAASHFPESVIIPLLLFSMTTVIAYDQELALLLSTVMALMVVVSLGLGLDEFTTYVASMATAVLCLRHVRSRTKLIYVGIVTASIAAATVIGTATLSDPGQGYEIFTQAAWLGFFSVVAGLLMTGLLPFIENLFDIQTELSLLELADVSHPLLQELVRRAPGTYNHTINVASIAEAAADSIGANGLLVRVGAYFHDIGKMLKPGYFIENQGDGTNRHESLLPAMSTLVIIAHVKDGADLARQHNLPNSLVDFIMQHHGTTLVEYFYKRASEQSESDPDGTEVDEHSYRYPGPKPQTKEAAVLMLADTVESAGRTLTDPTPSRIESLVHDLAMKKLLDGQFNECGLTLSELNKIEVSLIKSLSAVYHARIKYPDQQSA